MPAHNSRSWLARLAPTTGSVPVVAALLAALYFLAGKLGLQLAVVHPSATAIWPGTGIALAAILLFGYGVWPGIFLGAFAVNVTTAGSILSAVGIATGNTLEALVGAYLVIRFANGRKSSIARQEHTDGLRCVQGSGRHADQADGGRVRR